RSSHPHRGYRFAAARTFRVGHYRWRVNTPDPAILDAPPSETIDPACSGVEVDGCLACIRYLLHPHEGWTRRRYGHRQYLPLPDELRVVRAGLCLGAGP